MDVEHSVAQHYTHGSLEETILAALSASAKDIAHLTIERIWRRSMSFISAGGRRMVALQAVP